MSFPRLIRMAVVARIAGTGAMAAAQNLTVELSTPSTMLDPHHHNLSPNNGMARHVFETPIEADEAQRPLPGRPNRGRRFRTPGGKSSGARA